jgi:hypothetical protein
MKWISVFQGPIWQVSLVQARLQAVGFQTNVPDPTLKVLDPFIEKISAERKRRAEVADDDEVFGPKDTRRLYRLGRRIRWTALFGFTAPIALALAPGYFLRVRHVGPRPPAHGYVIAATVVAAAMMFQLFYMLGIGLLIG